MPVAAPSVDTASRPGFLASVAETFQSAAAASGIIDHYFTIAGRVVRLRFAGPALVPRLVPALAHLCTTAGPAALTVHLWDSASTNVSLPPPPTPLAAPLPRGEVTGLDGSRVQMAVGLDASSVSLLDTESQQGFYWIRGAEDVTVHERGAPLRALLHWWLRSPTCRLVHAAAVGLPDHGGVLLAGRGGSGKSTTALACLASGLLYAGDDYCLLDDSAEPCVHSLYSSAKVEVAQLRHFPRLGDAVANPAALASEKALIFLQPLLPAQVARGFPLRALLLPRLTGQLATRLSPATPFEALRALAPSSLMQLPGAGPADLAGLSRLVQRVPGYWLELGTDIAAVPAVIASLLTSA